MRAELTQGSIIAEIRSNKYDKLRCKGIVISARCDFAHDKISHFHYLSAMVIEDWIYEVLFYVLVEECIKNEKKIIRESAEKLNLDFQTLEEFGYEKMKEVFTNRARGKELTQILNRCDQCVQLETMRTQKDKGKKKSFLNQTCKKSLCSKIDKLICGTFPKYAFIPEKGYLDSDSLVHGLVVDLQDIYQMDMRFKEGLINSEYDYQIVNDSKLKQELNKFFFFENNDDFIILEGRVKSPWIEYILQMFANSFTRIGVDNASKDEISQFCYSFLGGDKE